MRRCRARLFIVVPFTMEIVLYKNQSQENVLNKTLIQIQTVHGVIRGEDDILNPKIEIEYTRGANYLFVPDFNRYYFIQNVIQFRKNMCKINCSVDVLMSYKNLILNSSGDVTQDVNQYSKESRYNVSEKTNLQTVEFTSPFDTTGSIIMVTTSGGVY